VGFARLDAAREERHLLDYDEVRVFYIDVRNLMNECPLWQYLMTAFGNAEEPQRVVKRNTAAAQHRKPTVLETQPRMCC
jgi:hypothetical protein